MNKIKFLALAFIAAVIVTVLTIGCGEDSTNNPPPGGTQPTINMQGGAVYSFVVDSILTNGNIDSTRLKTTHTYSAQAPGGSFQITSVTGDSLGGPTITDTFSVKYEGGKFSQYGALQLIDPSIPSTWDVVADFTVASGTEWSIINDVPFTIGPLTGTADVSGKIAEELSFTTWGWGDKSVHCYRSELRADLTVGPSVIGSVYVDYYIGDANPSTNPSGIVRIKLRPFTILGFPQPGLDQIIQKWQ